MDTRFEKRRWRSAWILAAVLVSCGDPSGVTPNEPPTVSFDSPVDGALFSGGEEFTVAITASDPEDGSLSGSSVTWWADLHHASHTHPFVSPTDGTSGTATIPAVGHVETNIFFRFYAVVVDSEGLVDTVTVDIDPRLVSVDVESDPSGLQILVDGQPNTTPFTIESVVGVQRALSATDPQSLGAFSWTFVSWSHGGEADQNYIAPSANTTITATYTEDGAANVPPTVSFTAPSDGDTLTVGVQTTVTVDAADSDGTVQSVQLLDGSTVIGTDTTEPFAIAWTPAGNGAHTLVARATDDGNSTVADTIMVTVVAQGSGDVVAPVTTLTSPSQGTTGLTGSVAITATATDDVGVTQVEFQVDGATVATDDTAPYEATLPATSVYASGAHTFRARARDAAGNWSPWSAASVTFGGGVALPDGFTRSTYASGFSTFVTAAAFAPDGRMFVTELLGAIRIVDAGGGLNPTPFAQISVLDGGERGLLGIALDPDFDTNGYVYIYYTTTDGGTHNRISRVTANGDVMVPGSEVVLVDLEALSGASNHNGGAMAFGPDGMLYVAVGDNANGGLSQSLTSRFGKILRYNPDGTIPADNPLVGSTSGEFQAIWATGLRNPYTIGFDPVTGRLHINDVGENTWEEINEGIAGANYGWPASEGPTSDPSHTPPLLSYGHFTSPTLFNGFAIVGAAFYRPSTNLFGDEYVGDYFFSDYVSGWIYRLDEGDWDTAYAFANLGTSDVFNMIAGDDGSLYVLIGNGVERITR